MGSPLRSGLSFPTPPNPTTPTTVGHAFEGNVFRLKYKRTALYDLHVAQGARLVPFGGWEMPVEFSGISKEHQAVRTGAGLFDVSHMGEFFVRGSGALSLLQHVTTNDVARLSDGAAQYTAMADPGGTVVDDLLVYRLASDHYMMVVNASNTDSDFQWLNTHNRFGADLENVSHQTSLVALQGLIECEGLGAAPSQVFPAR